MSVSSVLKAAMSLQQISRAELATRLGTSSGSIGVKFTRGAWSGDDLIRAAAAMGLQLALLDQQGAPVVKFKPEDAAPPRRSGQAASKEE